MSISIIQSIIEPAEDESLDDLLLRTEERMNHYAARHKDFSVVIEKHVDSNYLVVKSLILKESAN